MSDAFYQISNLDKYYGKFQALNAVDLQLSQGKIIGLLGKNGAGKSTLMRCMLGFLSFNGQISFDGHPIKRHDMRIFENVAFIPDVSGLDDRLTVQQTIAYVRGLNRDGTSLWQKSYSPSAICLSTRRWASFPKA